MRDDIPCPICGELYKSMLNGVWARLAWHLDEHTCREHGGEYGFCPCGGQFRMYSDYGQHLKAQPDLAQHVLPWRIANL